MKPISTKGILAATAALLLAACAPRLVPSQLSAPDHYLHAPTAGLFDTIGPRWWRIFGDTTLDRLIEEALRENRDIAVAASRIEAARANLRIVRAAFLPQVGVNIEAEGSRKEATGIIQTYTVAPALQWEISLFGAMRNAKRAARAELAASEWALRGIELSLAAEVATTYFTLLEYREDLVIARRNLALRTASAALIDSLFRYGMSDGVALEQARSLVYTAAADIPRYKRAIEQSWLSLGTLLGRTPSPSGAIIPQRPLLCDSLPAAIPVGLPSELMTRRPDIRQSRYAVERAAAQAGSARSARFPSLLLTAQGGVASSTVKGLTAADPWAWSVAGSLTQPIFAFGKLKRAEQVAVESYNQAVSQYEQTLLTAFAEVEEALVAIETCLRQAERTAALVAANRRIATMTRALWRSGSTDYLNYLDAERSLYASQLEWVNLAAQQRINYIALCKALGGGWEERAESEIGN